MLRPVGITAAVLLGVSLMWIVAMSPGVDRADRRVNRTEGARSGFTQPRTNELEPLLTDVATGGPTPETSRRQRGAADDPPAAVGGNPQPSAPATRPNAQLLEHPRNHPDAPGRIWDLGHGLTTAGPSFDNDAASAARVPVGFTLTLYVDAEGQGRRVVLPAGDHQLHPLGFGDCVSSVRVAREGAFDPSTPRGPSDAVQLHQHLPREGELGEAWNLRLPPSRTTRLFRASDGHFRNNEASAAWVPPGYEVTLFESGDGLGRALVLGPGFHELLPFDFNDRASSARVRRVPGGDRDRSSKEAAVDSTRGRWGR